MSLPELVDWQERKINELRAAVAEKDAHIAALVAALDQTHYALFRRCGGVPPATMEERRILDLAIPMLGLYCHPANLPAAAAAYTADVRRAALEEAAKAVCGMCRAGEPLAPPVSGLEDSEWRHPGASRSKYGQSIRCRATDIRALAAQPEGQ